MSSTTLTAISWVFVGAIIGIAVGWIATARALRRERQRGEERLQQELEAGERNAAKLAADVGRAKTRLAEFEKAVPELEKQLTEQDRALGRIQAQILDRESTINSLRSRLYGSRRSAALIEEQLEARESEIAELRRQVEALGGTVAATGSVTSVTVDLGSGLEIGTNQKESHSVDQG